jgi:hypothetical protein
LVTIELRSLKFSELNFVLRDFLLFTVACCMIDHL